MFEITTIPSRQRILESKVASADYMRANDLPWAVVVEEALSPRACDDILEVCNPLEPYKFNECHAITRECPRPLDEALVPAVTLATAVNAMYWQYDLDPEPAAWMQTYGSGGKYALHCDAQPGQMRKMTAVVMLSDPSDYEGGSLWVRIEPRPYLVSKKRGTVVVFPSWLNHVVETVNSGKRQTINLGFWGPNFR